jgi:hypothetical protein
MVVRDGIIARDGSKRWLLRMTARDGSKRW